MACSRILDMNEMTRYYDLRSVQDQLLPLEKRVPSWQLHPRSEFVSRRHSRGKYLQQGSDSVQFMKTNIYITFHILSKENLIGPIASLRIDSASGGEKSRRHDWHRLSFVRKI